MVKFVYGCYLFSWFEIIYMIHIMNRPQRNVSAWIPTAFVLSSVYVIILGFKLRKRLFKKSAEKFPSDAPKALALWKGAQYIGFTYASCISLFGAVLKFLGSNWYLPGIFFGLSLSLLLFWAPRQRDVGSAQLP
jgi:hypothetical protein